MLWFVGVICVLALVVIFATTKRGTASIVLGVLMLSGGIENLGRATPFVNVFDFTLAGVVVLWGLSYKLEARFLR